jgi:hypothetical protein
VQPGRLLGIWLIEAFKQLPRLGFDLARQGEVTFGVPVRHNRVSDRWLGAAGGRHAALSRRVTADPRRTGR